MAKEADTQEDAWPIQDGRVGSGSVGTTWSHGQFQSSINLATLSTVVDAGSLQTSSNKVLAQMTFTGRHTPMGLLTQNYFQESKTNGARGNTQEYNDSYCATLSHGISALVA